jgi:hypothetical protein
MRSSLVPQFNYLLLASATALVISSNTLAANAQSALYNPIPLPASNQITDTLSNKDIPTGSGGFERDYTVTFKEGDQVVIELTSKQFDTVLTLIAPDGTTATENDDGPDGTTNSMLFYRVTKAGNYIIRVSSYGGQGTGQFQLKLNRLKPE